MRFRCVLKRLDWDVVNEVGCMVKNFWRNLPEAVTKVFPKKKKKLKGNRIPKIVRKLLRRRKQILDKMI